MTIALQRPLLRDALIVATGLTASLLLPLIVHLLPTQAGPPAGARLLPIFFASLVLALRSNLAPAFVVALLAPLVNRALTGMPAGPMLPTLLLELTLFTLLIVLARRFVPRLARFMGPLAYLAAALAVRGLLVPDTALVASLGGTLATAWPGLIMLLAVGAVAGARLGGANRRPGPVM